MRRGFVLFRPDDGGGAGGGAGGNDDDDSKKGAAGGDDKGGAGAAGGDAKVTFTPEQQAHIDSLVADRVDRAKKATQKQTKTELEAEANRAAMGETERLKAELEDEKKKTQATTQQANERILRTEAKLQLTAKGYSPEQAAVLMRAIDLSAVDFDDAGEFDAKAVSDAIDAVAKVMPPATSAGTQRSGPDFKGGDNKGKRVYTKDEIAAMSPKEFSEGEADIDAAMAESGHPRIRE
jgi:hypothetical protein